MARQALSARLLAGLVLAGCAHVGPAAVEHLDPSTQPRFVNTLPNPLERVLVPDTRRHPGSDYYEMQMGEIRTSGCAIRTPARRCGRGSGATGTPAWA